jgi:cation transporter-like permease
MNPLKHHNKLIVAFMMSGGLASIGLIGGLGLQAVREELIAFTPLIIALPAMNAITGDYALLITTHLGDPETYSARVKKLLLSLLISVPITIFGISFVSLSIASIQNYPVDFALVKEFVVLIGLTLIAILSLTLIMVFITNLFLKKSTLNSDDILIPLTTTFSSLVLLMSIAFITLRLNG